MISMVAAGEAGGFLDEALDRIATMYESDAALRAKIKSALDLSRWWSWSSRC